MTRIWIIFILVHGTTSQRTVGAKRSAEDFLEGFCIETIKRAIAHPSVATGRRVGVLSHVWL
jgi:hypothetical protein